MGRIPCCDKVGIKKGPWTPEEDIILVSFIQEHGPGNWRAVPTNTGLRRCSKSCRLRWTNYLRPGIKRGSFTEQEEKMIIHLQALLGNKWAAIASYLPQRTDNDIKNYWNTHLKKKLKKQGGQDGQNTSSSHENNITSNSSSSSTSYNNTNRGQWERRLQTDIHRAKQALCEALSLDKPDFLPDPRHGPRPGQPSYAASADNIAKLLENWTARKQPGPGLSPNPNSSKESTQNSFTNNNTTNNNRATPGFGLGSGSGSSPSNKSITLDHNQGCDSLLGLHSSSNNPSTEAASDNNSASVDDERKPNLEQMMTSAMDADEHHHEVPVSLIERWLFEEAGISQDQVSLLDMTSLDDDPPSDLF